MYGVMFSNVITEIFFFSSSSFILFYLFIFCGGVGGGWGGLGTVRMVISRD